MESINIPLTVEIKKKGNSYYLLVPQMIVENLGIEEGDLITFEIIKVIKRKTLHE